MAPAMASPSGAIRTRPSRVAWLTSGATSRTCAGSAAPATVSVAGWPGRNLGQPRLRHGGLQLDRAAGDQAEQRLPRHADHGAQPGGAAADHAGHRGADRRAVQPDLQFLPLRPGQRRIRLRGMQRVDGGGQPRRADQRRLLPAVERLAGGGAGGDQVA